MPKIDPRVGQTVTIVAAVVALFGRRKVDMGRLEAGIAQLRADIADLRDRMTRPEAGQATTGSHGRRTRTKAPRTDRGTRNAADRSRPPLGAPASRRRVREARENADAGAPGKACPPP